MGKEIKVKADKYARVVELCGDGTFLGNYFDLLPGEEKTVTFDGNMDSEIKYTWFNK